MYAGSKSGMAKHNPQLRRDSNRVTGIVLLLVLYVLLALTYSAETIEVVDEKVALWLGLLESAELTKVVALFTELGAKAAYAAVFVLAATWMAIRWRRTLEPVTILAVLLGAWLVNTILKEWSGRYRPSLEHLVDATGFSFPSGHAMISLAFYGMIAFILWRKIGEYVWIPFTASILIILIGLSRIYLHVHFASDIVAGYLVGGACLLVAMLVYDYFFATNKRSARRRVGNL